MIYEQICEVVGAKATKSLDDFLESTSPISAELNFAQSEKLVFEDLAKVFHQVYDISIDDQHTRRAITQPDSVGATFATMRKQYRVRRECSAYTLVLPSNTSKNIQNIFSALGFNVQLG
jgi:erythronate-4-phosphate dehydrogenase